MTVDTPGEDAVIEFYCPAPTISVSNKARYRGDIRFDAESADQLRVALVDDRMDAQFFEQLAEAITAILPESVVTIWPKPAVNEASPPDLISQVADVSDVVVTGVGQCGSCTQGTIFDAVTFHQLGLPAVAVVWESFVPAARGIAALRGCPDLPLGITLDLPPHVDPDLLRTNARRLAPILVEQLGLTKGASTLATSST